MNNSSLFQDNWTFLEQPIGTTLEEVIIKQKQFQQIDIPHDWIIYESSNLPEGRTATGWYRKLFTIQQIDREYNYFLEFDGVYMDCTVYLNHHKLYEWKNGYTAFEVDLTSYLKEGENEIIVSVCYQTPNSRWYSGAGIFREVRWKKVNKNHIATNGIYITTKKSDSAWEVTIDTEVITRKSMTVRHSIKKWSEQLVDNPSICSVTGTIQAHEELQIVSHTLFIENPDIWDIEDPALYIVVTELLEGENVIDIQKNRFGFRTINFYPEDGFYLNGRKVKLNGVCEHHDLGSLGAAFNRCAMKRKFTILKEMGVNAVRLSHNMAAQAAIELAEEMGILIDSEAFDMWERSKTTYDYARFFQEWYKKDIASWVRRDRNSPCVIMWSIGNEIYDTHADKRGEEITKLLTKEVKKHDPKEHAKVTIASNYIPWENAQKCADIVKLSGYNYAERYYNEHHEKYPDWIIYGSETASIVQSRGIYHFPLEQQVLADDDEQCSALGNSTTSWGAKSVESCIITERDCKFSCGQFIWTGFDYIGEPTPYHTKNSYFGQIDTAGYPKDSYYIFQAAWTDYKKYPMIHLYPYWDFNEEQLIDICVCSNVPMIELFVNQISMGKKPIDLITGQELVAHWKVPYKKGVIRAVAYDESGIEIASEEKHSFQDASKIVLTPDKTSLFADGEDLIFVTITMEDREGNVVENANNRVMVQVSGAGRLVGLDNGDSTDYDEYKGKSRRLFSGKLLAIIAAKQQTGTIAMEVFSKGIETQTLTLQATEGKQKKGICAQTENKELPIQTGYLGKDEIPVRKIEIVSKEGNQITDKKKELHLKAVLYPENTTYQDILWTVTNDAGIPSNIASIKAEGKEAILKGLGDGVCRVRCMTKNGTEHIRLISQMEFLISGLGERNLNPYEFIYGGLYSYAKGRVGNGNERGVATANDGETQVGFENIDFGTYGSDEITIPIFALSGEAYSIQIWEGIPGEVKSELLADVIYQKPSIWNVYQEETYHLKRKLKGVTSITFVTSNKMHIKGFSFKTQNRALEQIYAGECESIYGDFFIREEKQIKEIGNNVSLKFPNMDFGEKGINQIVLCGHSAIEKNSIQIRFKGETGEQIQLIEFTKTSEIEEKEFSLEPVTGIQEVTFLFLPGSKFDFHWFHFQCK